MFLQIHDGDTINKTESLKECKKRCIRTARDLCYDDDVCARIRDAKTIYEIDRIMRNARNNMR